MMSNLKRWRRWSSPLPSSWRQRLSFPRPPLRWRGVWAVSTPADTSVGMASGLLTVFTAAPAIFTRSIPATGVAATGITASTAGDSAGGGSSVTVGITTRPQRIRIRSIGATARAPARTTRTSRRVPRAGRRSSRSRRVKPRLDRPAAHAPYSSASPVVALCMAAPLCSSSSWHATHVVASGTASSRLGGIDAPHSEQTP